MKRWLMLCMLAGSLLPAQTLLFKSGFESSTALGSIPGSQTCSYGQTFSGTDSISGFTWPPHLFGGNFELKAGGTCADVLVNHFFNSIQTVTGHTGSSTKALFIDIDHYTSECCPQAPFQSFSLTQPLKQVYWSYWVMWPSAYAAQLDSITNGYGREQFGWKTNDDYRETAKISRNGTSGHSLHSGLKTNAGGKSASNTNSCPFADPITGATISDCARDFYDVDNESYILSFGTWHHFEFFVQRVNGGPGGRLFTAVDGHISGDYLYTFSSYGVDNQDIADIYWANLYGNDTTNSYPLSQTLDDFEVWDSPPCGHLPCDTQVGSAPPAIISWPAAVGTVGVPFSFQPIATGTPTSWDWSGRNGSTPPGLSLNSSTGLISGTPTTPGRYQAFLNARNSTGGADSVTYFQINSSTVAPVIKSFGAYPSTVASGGPSTLYWNVLGAGTVSLSIDQSIGAVSGLSGSRVVNPTISTTYTLTAHNSAGTQTASTTVTVSGGGSAPVISSFTASPSSIVSGSSANLSLSSSGGTTCSINQGVGTVACNSITAVHPTFTTTYTATATNVSGNDTASATVTVTGITTPPTINSFTATPSTPITPGASVTLTWTSTGGTTATLNGSPVALSGTQIVSPLTTTAYLLVVSNSAGAPSQTVTVNVGALPVISSFTASPSTIALGSSSTLALASTGGTTCSIDQGVGTVACNSSTSVSPLTSKLYTATVTNSFGSKTAQVLVGVSISALVGASVVNGQVVIH